MRSASRRLLALFAALLAVAACEGMLTDAQPYGSVTVRATSRSGAPLPNIRADLFAGGDRFAFGLTDANGLVHFRLVAPGSYGVAMALPKDYVDLSQHTPSGQGTIKAPIGVERGRDTTVAFTFGIRGPGSLEVTLLDQRRRPVPAVQVGFYSSTAFFGYVASDSLGVARMDDLPFGNYGAFVSAPDSLGVPGAWIYRDDFFVASDLVASGRLTVPTCRGGIRVRLRDDANAVVPNVPIFLYTGRGVLKFVLTDSTGFARFQNVYCGGYGAIVGSPLPGYRVDFVFGQGYVDDIAVSADTTIVRNLRVTRAP